MAMVNVLKFRTPKFLTKWLMQNSADQDQTAPQGAKLRQNKYGIKFEILGIYNR